MPELIESPVRVEAAGDPPKVIEEYAGWSEPGPGGAEYVAVCLPAFSPQTVHRDAP
jgi:hypothetical protein